MVRLGGGLHWPLKVKWAVVDSPGWTVTFCSWVPKATVQAARVYSPGGSPLRTKDVVRAGFTRNDAQFLAGDNAEDDAFRPTFKR
jgi:hypothetical protein